MRGRLTPLSSREVLAALEKLGYVAVRQRGSHIRMRHLSDPVRKPVTVLAETELRPELVRKVIKDANLTVEEFMNLVKG